MHANGDEAKATDREGNGVYVEVGAISLDDAMKKYVTVIDSLQGYGGVGGSTIEEKLESLKSSHPVLIFSKSHCPFCLEAKRTFAALGVPVAVIEKNANTEGARVHALAKKQTKHSTVPLIFINGEYVGGCDELKKLQASRKLDMMVRDLIERKETLGVERLETVEVAPVHRGTARHPLGWFPNVVNNHVVRLTGCLVVLTCGLAIGYRHEDWSKWLVLFLAIDFFTRMLVGSSLSVLGMIATVLSSPFTPDFRAGPPKQFAACCGVMFSAIACGCYFADFADWGAFVLGLLAGAAGMEGFLDFCLGCLFFSWGVRFKLIPNDVYRIFTNSQEETRNAWAYANKSIGPEKPSRVPPTTDSKIALTYKKKSDEYILEDRRFVGHMQVGYFSVPMSLSGLAVAWKLATTWSDEWARSLGFDEGAFGQLNAHSEIWQTLGVCAAFVFCALFVLYLLRLALYPKKCLKEWQCPLRSNGFGMVSISIMLFAFLLYDVDSLSTSSRAARAFWWIGAGAHMTMTVIKFGEWVGKRLEIEHMHSSYMILPVGNLVAAMVAPLIDVLDEKHDDAGRAHIYGESISIEIASFCFSFAFLMWLVLFTLTFFKTLTTHNSDDRLRPLAFIWIAAPCLVGLSDLIICTSRNAGTLFNEASDCFPRYNQYFYIGLTLALGLGWACMPYIGYFGKHKFDISYWNFIFPLDTLASAATVYYVISGFEVAHVLSIICLAVASGANLLAFFHTCVALVRGRMVFTPEVKWGPLSHMKLLHEAVRNAMPELEAALNAVDLAKPETVHRFAALYRQFAVLHEEHAKHEEQVIFKAFNDFFHGHAQQWNDDHAADAVLLAKWSGMLNEVLGDADGEVKAAHMSALRSDLPRFLEHFLEHLKGEEEHLNPVGRKYVPLALQKELTRKVWDITDATRWEVIVPYIINNLPRHQQRTRYLKVLFWSMPERAQQIGAIVYRHVDAVMWERLRVDVPEMVPRGAFNWWRYY